MPLSCRVTRGDVTESIHVAFAVMVDEKNKIIFSTGDPHYLTCIRSSLKPFQAAVAVQSGAIEAAGFNERELALMCASHKGEDIHVETAMSMLHKLGLGIDDYECGAHLPSDKITRHSMIEQGKVATPVHNNCSGKHAGMLALAKHLGAETKGYVHSTHPVQLVIRNYISTITGLKDIPMEIDGCSVPTYFMTLQTIASMFQILAMEDKPEIDRVFKAMGSYPEMIGGTNHFDSMFISAMNGRGVTKVGGESIRGIALKTEKYGPIGISMKILDGSFRAMPIAVMKLMEHLELLSDNELNLLNKFRTKIIKNHNGIQIGKIEVYVDY
ncbi:MAG: asparaginase [Candidatus Neomarinimicrobiota bacterium]